MCLRVLPYPGGCISAKFLGVGFIKGGEEFEDGVGTGVAFGTAKDCEFDFQVFGQDWAAGPYLFDEIGRNVVHEPEGAADNLGLCHD